jgi:hypothetical protein
MDGLETQIALAQARLTSAVRSGEPQDSPQVHQVDAAGAHASAVGHPLPDSTGAGDKRAQSC